MRRAFLLAGTAMLLATAAPAMAHPTVELAPTLPTDLTHARTDNVEYLGRFPEHFGTAGGRLVGDTFFITDGTGVTAYDVSDAASPTRVGRLVLPQVGTGLALAQEDVDTDGHVLLVDAMNVLGSSTASRLQVVDVSNPAAMRVLSSIAVTDHTWTCVTGVLKTGETRGCAYAYGRTGHIIDLTDPANPVNLPKTWREQVGYGLRTNSPYTHDLTEIKPGLVMSAGSTNVLMDTRDPAAPVLLNKVAPTPGRFPSLGYHSVEWANGGTDPIAIFGTEIAPSGATNTAGSDCNGPESVIETWDASAVVTALEAYWAGDITATEVQATRFVRADAYSVSGRGLFIAGDAPGHVLYCAHWFEYEPAFDGTGMIAVSYYDRGTRFVEVGTDGKMTEKGWMTPAEGYAGSPQWITDEIVYVMDYRRGMEVLRLDRETEATGVVHERGDVLAANSVITPADLAAMTGGQPERAPATVFAVGMLGLTAGLLRRRWVATRA